MEVFYLKDRTIFYKDRPLTLEEAVSFLNEGEEAIKILFRLNARGYILTNDEHAESECNRFVDLASDSIKRYQKLKDKR